MDKIPSDEELTLSEALGWAEYCAWSTLVMAPVIYWLQGESVSHDQFVVRTGFVILAAASAFCLRARALWLRQRASKEMAAQRTGPDCHEIANE
jgi:hypothetical protein